MKKIQRRFGAGIGAWLRKVIAEEGCSRGSLARGLCEVADWRIPTCGSGTALPGRTLPEMFPGEAERKAAYRLLSNREVAMDDILEPHLEAAERPLAGRVRAGGGAVPRLPRHPNRGGVRPRGRHAGASAEGGGAKPINYPLLTLRSFVRPHRPMEEDAGGEDRPGGPELEDSGERLPLGGLEPRDSGEFDSELADGRVRRRLGAHAVASEGDPEDFGCILRDDVDDAACGGGVEGDAFGAVEKPVVLWFMIPDIVFGMAHFANRMHAELTAAPRQVDGLAFRSRHEIWYHWR